MIISLTNFVDFIVSSGSPRLTIVRKLKSRGEYHPAMDFWKALRERIVDYHQAGEGDKQYISDLMNNMTDTKKHTAYPPLITGYKKFVGNKQPIYSAPPKADWHYKGLVVRVNPELILTIKDRPTIVKFYFKAEQLSKIRIDAVLLLLSLALQDKLKEPHDYGILDIRRSRLYSSAEPDVKLAPLLYGEAESFLTIWGALD